MEWGPHAGLENGRGGTRQVLIVSSEPWFSTQVICSPGDIQQSLEKFLIVTDWGTEATGIW